MRGLLRPRFLLMLTVFIFCTTPAVWLMIRHSNDAPQSPSPPTLRKAESHTSGPCKDCSNADKMMERDSHSLKKQQDNLKSSKISDKVVERDSHSLKKQEDNLKNSSNVKTQAPPQQSKTGSDGSGPCKDCSNADKMMERDSHGLKKQQDNLKSSNVKTQAPPQQSKTGSDGSGPCKDCSNNIIDKIVERYSVSWRKQEDNLKKFRSLLSSKCNGFTKAMITQANTPLDSEIKYDAERNRKPFKVTPELFNAFPKGLPFLNKSLDTCAVIGNGGILGNSSCGESIDSAQFVFRCNLPPVSNGYEKDVGSKTNFVTANPTIITQKHKKLTERRRPFLDSLSVYGDSFVLLPAFAYGFCTPLSLRALYTIQDFESPLQVVFLNPEYVQSLAQFWRSQGLKEARLSTGLIVVSLALEVCSNVHMYGFWPFSEHPYGHQPVTNHYYDDVPYKKTFHAMPAEFEQLLSLHNQGVLRLHLGNCPPSTQ